MPRTMTTPTTLLAADLQKVSVGVQLADLATAGTFWKWTPGKPGKITALDWVTNKPATTAAKLASVTPSINGTALAGCVVALTSANCTPVGAKVAGSAAPSTGVTFGATDEIGLVSSAITVFVEGSGYFVLSVEFGTQ
jgi:hypothetical protein